MKAVTDPTTAGVGVACTTSGFGDLVVLSCQRKRFRNVAWTGAPDPFVPWVTATCTIKGG